MSLHTLVSSVPNVSSADLCTALINFANQVDDLRTPADVLDALHVVSTTKLPLNVMGAARFPLKAAGIETIRLGKSCFLHRSVPDGWWEEYTVLARTPFHTNDFPGKV